MNILFVIDNYENQSNGGTITTKRFKEARAARGHTVKVLTIATKNESHIYSLEEKKIPLVNGIISKQDMKFAVADKKKIREALSDIDICHLVFPFKLSRVTNEIAKSLNIPVVTSYHIMPENITYGAGVRRLSPLVNWMAYIYFDTFYKKVDNLHLLSKMSSEFAAKRYTNATRYVISNGVINDFTTIVNHPSDDKIRIISIGRYSKEKAQDITIKAIAKSKYKDRIELVLPGKGKQEKKLRKLANKYHIDVKFGFLNKQELMKALETSYMFVHSAEIEIEGMSCLEAIASGVVPIISNAKKSASRFFSIEANNSYKNRNTNDLKDKIEYWIENKQARENNLKAYKEFIKNYRFENSVDQFEEMYQDIIDRKNNLNIVD
ncbi:Glycosyltransferase, group 1 [Alteracholeplasma palmae J233]|uniref:Glycosyltransferase, group 1 n=1 Tax=Alteracholeplasma palmae (strain ATCC 49389 / J233) TaxID=1318466 RepID=U4KKZ8_ALTPJ|nr:glycosyltransferase [Alteracholeplasma palmae]CCV64397.1 Glycosyltransferase, group 1 [Alteracholeplasma palmae J233]